MGKHIKLSRMKVTYYWLTIVTLLLWLTIVTTIVTYYCDIFSNDCDIRPSEVGQCGYGRYACTVQEVTIMVENVDIQPDLPDLRS